MVSRKEEYNKTVKHLIIKSIKFLFNKWEILIIFSLIYDMFY